MSSITIPDNELTSFDLPRVCVVTGATEGIVFKPVKFQWYPRWVPVLVLVNLLIALIVAFALTKRVKGELPFTEKAYKDWRLGTALHGISVFVAIMLFVGMFVFFIGELPVAGFACMIATLAVPIGVWARFVRGKSLKVTRIADGKITLDIPSISAALAIKQHLRGGLRQPGLEPGFELEATHRVAG